MSDIRRTYRNQKQGADFFPWEISISVKLVTLPPFSQLPLCITLVTDIN